MTRHDRTTRRLVVCRACKNDRGHLLRGDDGTLYVVCTSCGEEMLSAQGAPAAVT